MIDMLILWAQVLVPVFAFVIVCIAFNYGANWLKEKIRDLRSKEKD